MPRFFCENITSEKAVVEGGDAVHIAKALRMKVGDEVVLCDKKGYDYNCEITSIGEVVEFKVISSEKNLTEPSVKVTLYQCLPKSDKFEFIIQKAVEMGATKIVPVQSEFCIARGDKKSFEKKLERYNSIAEAAAKQCGRGIIPTVAPIIDFKKAVENAQDELKLIFYEHGGEMVSSVVDSQKSISIFIGSEGGFSQNEVELAEKSGIKTATLGKLILRCETAPIAALALIMHEYKIM